MLITLWTLIRLEQNLKALFCIWDTMQLTKVLMEKGQLIKWVA